MPLFRVKQERKVVAVVEFLVRAETREAADNQAMRRTDPDNMTIRETVAPEHLRTVSVNWLDSDDDGSAPQVNHASPVDDEEEDEEYDEEEDELDNELDEYEEDSGDEDPEEDDEESADEDDDEDDDVVEPDPSVVTDAAAPPAPSYWAPFENNTGSVSAENPVPPVPVFHDNRVHDDAEGEESEEEEDVPAAAGPGDEFGPDDANWTHNVVFSINEMRPEARAAFAFLVKNDLLARLYDEVWSMPAPQYARARLWQLLPQILPGVETDDPAPRDRLVQWAATHDRNLEAIVNAVARYGQDTVRCKFCHVPVPSRTAHLHEEEWVGDECCWTEQLRASE